MRREQVDIIIVNWNSGPRLRACLESIARQRLSDVDIGSVVVVDNGSTDSSLSECGEVLGTRLQIVRNEKNLGFGRACNVGARHAHGAFLLFLNPDSVLNEDSIVGAVAALRDPKYSSVAVCGIKLVDESGRPGRTCTRFPTPWSMTVHSLGLNRLFPRRVPSYVMSEWSHEDTAFVDHVIGAFYLVRNDAFESVGGFDERFFVYMEDLDLSRRLASAGWRVLYSAAVSAYHEGGGSSKQIRGPRLFYSLRSRLQYCQAHFGRLGFLWVGALTLIVEPFVRVGMSVVRLDFAGIGPVLAGYKMLYGSLLRGNQRTGAMQKRGL